MRWYSKNAKGTFILIHGAFEHSNRYRWFIGQLTKNGYHVISGDLPGHGVHTVNRGDISSFNKYLESVDRWYDEAKLLGLPIYFFGHSMGGLIVIRYLQTRDCKIESVFLSSPCLGIAEPPENISYSIAKMIYSFFPKLKVRVPILNERITSNRHVQLDIKNDPLFLNKVTIRWFIELEKAIDLAFSEITKTKELPFFLMQAGEDFLVKKDESKRWFDEYKSSRKVYREFSNMYHELINEERKEDVVAFMLECLRGRKECE